MKHVCGQVSQTVQKQPAVTAATRDRSEASGIPDRTRFLTRRGNEAAFGDEGAELSVCDYADSETKTRD